MLLLTALLQEREKLIKEEIENELVRVFDDFETSVRVSFNGRQATYFVWLLQGDKGTVYTMASWAADDKNFRHNLFMYYYQQMLHGLTP